MKPKILIGTPTYDGKEYCLDFWVGMIKKIQKEGQKIGKIELLLIDNSKTDRYSKLIKNKYKIKVIRLKPYKKQPLRTLAKSREILYGYAIKNNYDYLLSIEQDIFPPIDIISTLLKTRKETGKKEAVIGTPYVIQVITQENTPHVRKGFLTNTALGKIYYKKLRRMIQKNLTRDEMKKRTKLMKVYAAGMGCTLIDVSILKKIKVKYTEKTYRPDDAFLYLDLSKMNIPAYVDPNLMDKILHIEGSNLSIASWGKARITSEK